MMSIPQKQKKNREKKEDRPLEAKIAVITETSHPQAHETESFPCRHNALSGWLTGWAKQ